mgnify:CR=1 FL=1
MCGLAKVRPDLPIALQVKPGADVYEDEVEQNVRSEDPEVSPKVAHEDVEANSLSKNISMCLLDGSVHTYELVTVRKLAISAEPVRQGLHITPGLHDIRAHVSVAS